MNEAKTMVSNIFKYPKIHDYAQQYTVLSYLCVLSTYSPKQRKVNDQ